MTDTVTKKRQPPAKGGSRKGIPNKVTSDLRSMVLQALSNAGGVDYLERQAKKKNPAAFLALVGKCIPKDVNVTANVTLADLLKQCRERDKS
jgi:hypothetical protein